jgi:hypothetical protein
VSPLVVGNFKLTEIEIYCPRLGGIFFREKFQGVLFSSSSSTVMNFYTGHFFFKELQN